MLKKYYFLVMIVIGSLLSARAQQLLPYKDATLPIDTRVKDLLSRMTPEEKSDIKRKGKDFLNKNMGNMFGNKPATAPVNQSNDY